MLKQNNLKDHALHNEKVCNLLLKNGDFPDWVVTTAFYSALHYAQFASFPYNTGKETFNSFDNYYNRHFNGVPNKPSKHQATINLVYAIFGDDAGYLYKWLHDTCRTSRYHKYKIPPALADLAKEKLIELKEYLMPS